MPTPSLGSICSSDWPERITKPGTFPGAKKRRRGLRTERRVGRGFTSDAVHAERVVDGMRHDAAPPPSAELTNAELGRAALHKGIQLHKHNALRQWLPENGNLKRIVCLSRGKQWHG